MMSRLIVLVHPRYTGPGFTSTSPALKRRDRRYRAGCAPSAIEKGEVGMKGVCSLRLPQHSLVDGLVGFECRHLAASRWTPREGPNSCPTVVVVVVAAVVVAVDVAVVVAAVVVAFVVAVVVFVVAAVVVAVVAVAVAVDVAVVAVYFRPFHCFNRCYCC